MYKLERDFYLRDTLTVARELLGMYIIHDTDGRRLSCRIVETEAYIGPEDKGSHSYGGKRTSRNEAMYYIGGTAYVYIIYGMHSCFNVVTEKEGKPSAVLIRAMEPVEGEEYMAQLRYGCTLASLSPGQRLGIGNGPGKLCSSMKIGKAENKLDLCGDRLFLTRGEKYPIIIKSTPRINIDYAGEYVQKPWRFYIEGNRYVSRK